MCACVCVCVCARGRRAGCCGRAGPGRSGRWTTSPPSSHSSEPGRPAGRPGSKPFFDSDKTEAHSPSPALGPGLAGGEVASTVRVTTRNTVPVTSLDREKECFDRSSLGGGAGGRCKLSRRARAKPRPRTAPPGGASPQWHVASL